MANFHQEIAERLERHLKDRRVVVLYDPRMEFEPFIGELVQEAEAQESDATLTVGSTAAWFCRFEGSFLALKYQIEQQTAESETSCGLVYVPGVERDKTRSPLMEFDLAGLHYEPQLRRLARDVLRHRFSDAQIDELIEAPGVGYQEISDFFGGAAEKPSVLRSVFSGSDSETILATWLLDTATDAHIETKGASNELLKLIKSRVGLELAPTTDLTAARRNLVRYVLINEFRFDLDADHPSNLELIPHPTLKEHRERIRAVAEQMRRTDPLGYGILADQVESDHALTDLVIEASDLGAVDTFRFEEQRLLEETAHRLGAGDYAAALALTAGRKESHWVRSDPRRLAQWSACAQAAELGQQVSSAEAQLTALANKPPTEWIERYTQDSGLSDIDGQHRRLGAFLSSLDEEPVAAQAINHVVIAYDEWVRKLTEGFVRTLSSSQWDIDWDLHQTQIFDDVVGVQHGSTAFFVVDAFRYEMAMELSARLDRADQIRLQAAVAALPTITPVGMAALLPGASTSFSVNETTKGVAGTIEGETLPDWPARWTHLQAKVPGAVELRLEQLLQCSPEELATLVDEAVLVLVRSQELDAVGEASVGLVAQQAMATLAPNLARAVHRLSKAGIRRFVISADHGHLLGAHQQDDMKIEAPGGDTVDLHRRCWAGRGGKTPAGAIRVSGANLGYDTDLDFVFPAGRGVFMAGGGLQYHHGGLSLQELIVPVLTLSMESDDAGPGPETKVVLHEVPERITNRTVGVTVELASDLFAEPQWVRVVMLHDSEQVGEAGMVQGAEMDPQTKRILLTPGQPAIVGLMLSRDDCSKARLMVLDADTEAVMAQSKNLKVSLSI